MEKLDISKDQLIIGILHEAISVFSRQNRLDSFWQSVCENSRWLIPSQYMCILLKDQNDTFEVTGRLEGNNFLGPMRNRCIAGKDVIGLALKERHSKWFTVSKSDPLENDELRKCFFKGHFSTLLSVPLHNKKEMIGSILFLFGSVSPQDQSKIRMLSTIYALHAGSSYALIKTQQEIAIFNEKLRASEENYRALYDNSPDMYISVSAKTAEILQCNQTLLNALGYDKEQIVGHSIFSLYHPNCMDKVKVAFGYFIKTGEVRNAELQVKRKDGSTMDIILNASAVRDEKGNILYSRSTWRDITERKRLETMMLHSEKMNAVGQLAGGVAHEINNPLSVILGFSQSVLKKMKEGDPLLIPLRAIEREAKRCKNLVQDLLVFSRKRIPGKKLSDLNELILSSLSLVEAQTKVKNIELIKDLDKNTLEIPIVPNQIQQVLVNLGNNAIDAMPKGGTLKIMTRKHVDNNLQVSEQDHMSDMNGKGNAKYVKISISDTGEGMSHETQSQIFEPFFTTKEVGKGTGLGLSLVYEIIKEHKGTIATESEVGKGTVFHILLPTTPES